MPYALRPCFQPALQRLDLLLHREILRLRAAYQLSLDEFRGLYISDQQVDALIQEWSREQEDGNDCASLTEQAEALAINSRQQLEQDPQWHYLSLEFALSPLEQDVLMLALAPELSLKYETLYAYLNNDVTRKSATIDLALRLFGEQDMLHARAIFNASSPLFEHQLLSLAGKGQERFSLAAAILPAPAVINHLLGLGAEDSHLHRRYQYQPPQVPNWHDWVADLNLTRQLQGLPRLWHETRQPPWMVLEGEPGSGRALAAGMALGAANKGLIRVNLTALASDENDLPSQLQRLVLQTRLRQAGLYFEGLDDVMNGDHRERRTMLMAMQELQSCQLPLFIAVATASPWRRWLPVDHSLALLFDPPSPGQRRRLWQMFLHQRELISDEADLDEVAERFQLNGGQIRNAIETVRQQRLISPNGQDQVSREQLFTAARSQSLGDIGKLAEKVNSRFRWSDLVLPETTLKRIRQTVVAIRHRHIVFRDWDMQSRLGGTQGMLLLFSGASGTGKTMTACVMAEEIGLDLYRIDLSGIVSKYIGDTEKNMDQIFRAASRANCILFFDEAEALFGKRSETKDAHDRYANIETAYLLQKIEQHDGVVILATNIAKNMDPAFSRRIHYAVDFPRPNAEHRELLWNGMFPEQTPIADDVDFTFLAREFDTTGGDIKTIALDAAMLAASEGQQLNMQCLVQAMAHQLIKQGQAPSATAFKQYYGLLSQEQSLKRGHALCP